VYSRRELTRRRKDDNAFVNRVLAQPKVWIIGTEDDLSERGEPDYVRMACTSASTSFRERLRPDELVRILLSGKVPAARRPHLRVILEELPAPVLEGVVRQVERWSNREKVLENLASIAGALGTTLRTGSWTTPA
jgi:hypothetical protein